MRKMGFVDRLSHDCHIDIDRDVSTAYYRSSSGDSVDLLSIRTIFTAMVVIVTDVFTNLAYGWWVSIQSICIFYYHGYHGYLTLQSTL